MRKKICTSGKSNVSSFQNTDYNGVRRELIVVSSPEKNEFRGRFLTLCFRAGYLRQMDLAKKLKVDPSTIRAISYGNRLPSTSLLYALWDVLGDDFPPLLKTSPAWAEFRQKEEGERKPKRKQKAS